MYLAHYSWAHVGPGWRYAVGEKLYPPVALLFYKTSVIADLQVVDKQPGPGTCSAGRYLGMLTASTW